MAGRAMRGRGKRAQWLVAALVIVAAALFAAWGRAWPFRSEPKGIEAFASPSVWQYLFSDRLTLGFVRLAIVFASLYLIVSVTALGVARRWMSGFGGLSVDEKESAEDHISALEERLQTTQAQLDEELGKRQETEDWADELIEQLDQTQIELDQAKEELESEHGEDSGGDSNSA